MTGEATEQVRLRADQDDYQALGLDPGKIMPWEDGRRLSQGGDNYEWWYLDSEMDDGIIVVATVADNVNGDGRRYVNLVITLPDGRTRELRESADEPGVFAADHTSVRIGRHSFDGDLDTYHLLVHPDNAESVGVDLILTRKVPSFRAATGYVAAGEQFMAWLNAVPHGTIEGTLTIDGQTLPLRGAGYHDHNWGNVPPYRILSGWWWGRATVGGRTVVIYSMEGIGEGAPTIPLYYVGSPAGIELNAAGPEVSVTTGPDTAHSDPGRTRPIASSVSLEARGYRSTFRIAERTILSLNMTKELPAEAAAQASALGLEPWYTRYASPVTLDRIGVGKDDAQGILERYDLQ